MAATKQSRATLNQLFSDGERPTGENFASAWMSFLNQTDDGVSIDLNKNLKLSGGITPGNTNAGPPGTIRYDTGSNQIQYTSDGVNFKNISSDGGAFSLVEGSTSAVAYSDGNVGIGAFSSPPTHLFEVPLQDNSVPGQEVLLGNLVIHAGPLATPGAYVGNNALATDPAGYALFQDGNGRTKLNARNANNSQLSLAIDNVDKFIITRVGDIQLSPTTNVTMNGDVNIGDIVVGHTLTISNSAAPAALIVNGVANKTGGGVWGATSDKRVKKEVRPFHEGLQKLLLFDPVIYKFNGKGGTIDNGKDYIGLIAQDVQKVMPELIVSQHIKLNAEDSKESDVLGHDLSPLTFMFINAIKEINDRLEKLEKPKKNANRKTDNPSGANN